MRQPASATQIDAYLAGLRSERRANKQKEREQAETLKRLLAATVDSACSERAIGDVAGAQQTEFQAEGIRECIKALGFSEKGVQT